MIAPPSSLAFPERGDGGSVIAFSRIAGAIALRPAMAADLPYLRQLYGQTREQELAPLPWPNATKQAFLDHQFALQHDHYVRHYGGAEFLILERDGAPVGRYYLLHEAADYLVIDISIDRSMQRRGIGGALIACTQSMAAESNRGVRLHVQLSNVAARRLYTRLGFRPQNDDQEAGHVPMRWVPLS